MFFMLEKLFGGKTVLCESSNFRGSLKIKSCFPQFRFWFKNLKPDGTEKDILTFVCPECSI